MKTSNTLLIDSYIAKQTSKWCRTTNGTRIVNVKSSNSSHRGEMFPAALAFLGLAIIVISGAVLGFMVLARWLFGK